jgi:hypothetical protein
VPFPFETGIQQVTSSVGTTAAVIFSPSTTSSTTYGPLGSIAVGSVLKDLVIVNTGTVSGYIGMGSASAATTTGLQVVAGGTAYLYGYNVTAANNSTGNVWANTASGTTSFIVGLATSPAGV